MENLVYSVEPFLYNILNMDKSLDEWVFVSPNSDSYPDVQEAAKQNYRTALSLTGDQKFAEAWAKLTWSHPTDPLDWFCAAEPFDEENLLIQSVVFAERDLEDVVQVELLRVGPDVYTVLIIGENCTFIGNMFPEPGNPVVWLRLK